MPLVTDPMETLIKKNLALTPGIITTINVAGNTTPAPTAGDGTNVDDAIWVGVQVQPTGGSVEFDVYTKMRGVTDYAVPNGGGGYEAAEVTGWKEVIRIPFDDEVYVRLTGGTATSVEILIVPMEG